MNETKHLSTRAVLKTDEGAEGQIEAIFSSFGVLDRDGDIVEAGAIPNGQSVPMVWAHDWSRIIGKGTTETDNERAVFSGQLFLDTTAGLDAYKTIKAMENLQEYSWGFQVLESDFIQRDEEQVRVIKRAELFEVSPVLVGAGRGTQTLSLKNMSFADESEAALAAVESLLARSRSLAGLRLKEGRALSSVNRERLAMIADVLTGASGELAGILKDTEPVKAVDFDALLAGFMTTWARQNGVTL